MAATVSQSRFGALPDGTPIEIFTLTNATGIEVRAMSYGATLVSIRTPDRAGQFADIALGFDRLDDYVTRSRFFGALVGRYGNRIGNARFAIDGQTFRLAANNGPNHLHGGLKGFDKVVWSGKPFEREGAIGVTFTYTSRDGEEGYPGTLQTTVVFTAPVTTCTNLDTGNLVGTVDISPFVNQAIRIVFEWFIPESFTGPGFFQLDNVLVHSPVPVELTGFRVE